MINYLIIPGLGNSGQEHWQTYFESLGDNFSRIEQEEWDAPACKDWISNVQTRVATLDPASVVLIGHSLGCATIAHWAKEYGIVVRGAMLVAPSDLEAPRYNFPATGFSPIPLAPLKFKTVVVASSNDEWVTLERAQYFANCWGSEFVNIGEAGHINAASGHYHWKEGFKLLKKFD